MNLFTYILIFIFKVIENTLSTLRIIIVANGKKLFGAILQGIIAIIWVISAGIVIINIKEDPIKIIFFSLGSSVGSYIGSLIEEKIALGNSLITAIINDKKSNLILRTLRKKGYIINTINTNNKKRTITIIVLRKNINKVSNIIKSLDNNSIIIAHNINPIY